jgi:DNA-binding transcriptional MerR regulator
MRIKEIEKLSGMGRANIRFYEREGLLTAKRMDNGYRDYSEDDLQILLRIKLLRSLHISLDEIRALKDGSQDLADTLSRQIVKLEQEKRDASYAQDVCRTIQQDKVTFADLDALKYLEDISRTLEETDSQYFSVKEDELPQVFNPWRRFLARMFDVFMYELIWSAFLAFIWQINLTTRSNWGSLLDSFIAIALMLILEPLWLQMFGTTPGKAIFGLKIESADGRHLSYSEGLERTWNVIGSGMGYNIPVYNLIRLWKSYVLCSEKEPQPWDESIFYTLKDRKWYRGVFYVAAHAALFSIAFTLASAQLIPPNRGDLTVAEYVENYNYYAKYFGVDFGNKYLDENGEWTEKDFNGTVYVDIGHAERPEYHFTIENESVTGVSFAVEIKNNQNLLTSYDTQMVLASLALAGAQKEMGLFSKIPSRIAEQIEKNTFQDFHFTEAGITVTCDIEYSGYRSAQSYFLLPEEDTAETYFSLDFAIDKT